MAKLRPLFHIGENVLDAHQCTHTHTPIGILFIQECSTVVAPRVVCVGYVGYVSACILNYSLRMFACSFGIHPSLSLADVVLSHNRLLLPLIPKPFGYYMPVGCFNIYAA